MQLFFTEELDNRREGGIFLHDPIYNRLVLCLIPSSGLHGFLTGRFLKFSRNTKGAADELGNSSVCNLQYFPG